MTESAGSKPPRSQAQRRADTRRALMDTARALFLEKGYDQTGLPELVRQAGLTRGALYHHFADKADLFRALAQREADAVSNHVAERAQTAPAGAAMDAGIEAYFDAMAVPGRATLLLTLAPAVLGPQDARALVASGGFEALRDGLAQTLPSAAPEEIDALAAVLAAGFDRAAEAIAEGAPRAPYSAALRRLLAALAAA